MCDLTELSVLTRVVVGKFHCLAEVLLPSLITLPSGASIFGQVSHTPTLPNALDTVTASFHPRKAVPKQFMNLIFVFIHPLAPSGRPGQLISRHSLTLSGTRGGTSSLSVRG